MAVSCFRIIGYASAFLLLQHYGVPWFAQAVVVSGVAFIACSDKEQRGL